MMVPNKRKHEIIREITQFIIDTAVRVENYELADKLHKALNK